MANASAVVALPPKVPWLETYCGGVRQACLRLRHLAVELGSDHAGKSLRFCQVGYNCFFHNGRHLIYDVPPIDAVDHLTVWQKHINPREVAQKRNGVAATAYIARFASRRLCREEERARFALYRRAVAAGWKPGIEPIGIRINSRAGIIQLCTHAVLLPKRTYRCTVVPEGGTLPLARYGSLRRFMTLFNLTLAYF